MWATTGRSMSAMWALARSSAFRVVSINCGTLAASSTRRRSGSLSGLFPFGAARDSWHYSLMALSDGGDDRLGSWEKIWRAHIKSALPQYPDVRELCGKLGDDGVR